MQFYSNLGTRNPYFRVDMTKRIGATSRDTIDPTILQQLNEGTIQSATLSELLAVDFACLMRHGFPGIGAGAIDRMHIVRNSRATI